METVGEFVLVAMHCMAHIKIDELTDDYNPHFLREFYKVTIYFELLHYLYTFAGMYNLFFVGYQDLLSRRVLCSLTPQLVTAVWWGTNDGVSYESIINTYWQNQCCQ